MESTPNTPSVSNQRKSLERDLKKWEDQIEGLEKKKAELENEMLKPEVYSNFEALKKLQFDLDKLKKELAQANAKWEEIATAIDKL